MKRSSLDVVLGPFCTAAKRTSAVIRIEMEGRNVWVAKLLRSPRGGVLYLVTRKTAASAAHALESVLEIESIRNLK